METSGVYKITNTATGEFYIGSSKDVKNRWESHKWPSAWKQHPNNPMYIDMRKYGLDKFEFQILEEVEPCSLKEKEQQFIEMLKPTYNDRNANGLNIERYKEKYKEYQKSERRKEYNKEYNKEYQKSDRYKEYKNKYQNQLCSYNGETITLNTLRMRFRKSGIEHPSKEAKKYLLK